MANNSGGLFFPVDTATPSITQGATLRDYFAGQILAAMLVQDELLIERDPNKSASRAYDLAQALVDEKNRRGA